MITFSSLDGSLRSIYIEFELLCFFFRLPYHRNGPLLVVASGSDTISVASSIRRLAMENVFVVQVKSLP